MANIEETNEDSTSDTMINLPLSSDDDIEFTVNLRVIGMMCQMNCGMFKCAFAVCLLGVLFIFLIIRSTVDLIIMYPII
jgi:hypothetical protein